DNVHAQEHIVYLNDSFPSGVPGEDGFSQTEKELLWDSGEKYFEGFVADSNNPVFVYDESTNSLSPIYEGEWLTGTDDFGQSARGNPDKHFINPAAYTSISDYFDQGGMENQEVRANQTYEFVDEEKALEFGRRIFARV